MRGDPESEEPGGCGGRPLCSREAVAGMGGVARTGALRCAVTRVEKPPSAQDAVGARLKVAEGAGKSGTYAFCLWLEVTLGLECFFSFFFFFRSPPPASWRTPMFLCL